MSAQAISENTALAERAARYSKLTLELEPELGRCRMSVRDVLSLAPGSLIRLSRPVGSRLDVFVAGAPFASGELVALGSSYAVRIADFHNPNKD